MASFSINVLRSRPRKKDGKMQIVAQISAHGSSFIHSGIYVFESEWDTNNRIVLGKDSNALNRTLKLFALRIQHAFNSLYIQGKLKTTQAKEIKRIIEYGELLDSNNSIIDTTVTDDTKPIVGNSKKQKSVSFFDFADIVLERINKQKTRETYVATKEKLKQFYKSENPESDINNLIFNDIDVGFVKRLDLFMEKQGLAVNTRSFYLRNLRKFYNDAIDENIASLEAYPFRRFKIKNEETKHRNMEIDELIKLRNHSEKPHQRQYIDMFFLGFYLIGINMVDLCGLTEITRSGRVEYRRSKTGRLYSIKVEQEAMKLIKKYRGKNHLLNIMDRYGDHTNYLNRLNKNLKEIDKRLSWYYARHTWATIAAELDVPDDVIKMALGHGKKTVTDVYIKRNQKKVDDANRKVIDYINNYKI